MNQKKTQTLHPLETRSQNYAILRTQYTSIKHIDNTNVNNLKHNYLVIETQLYNHWKQTSPENQPLRVDTFQNQYVYT